VTNKRATQSRRRVAGSASFVVVVSFIDGIVGGVGVIACVVRCAW
jgi:hypothetical protein